MEEKKEQQNNKMGSTGIDFFFLYFSFAFVPFSVSLISKKSRRRKKKKKKERKKKKKK